jgi:hypothetical protein
LGALKRRACANRAHASRLCLGYNQSSIDFARNRARLTGCWKMPTIKNGRAWADYVRNIFVPSLEFYRRVVMEKFLPSLSDQVIKEESDRAEEAALERMGRSVAPEDYDPGDFVEAAFNEGLEFYELMRDTRQGLVNGFAAALYRRSGIALPTVAVQQMGDGIDALRG